VHQPIRALLAALLAAAALTIVVAVTSSAATPVGFVGGGGSEPGSPGSGLAIPPATKAPRPSCGPTTNGSASGPNASVATLPCLPGPQRRPQPLVVVPRSGMANVQPIAFASAAVRSDDRTVDVRFWSGIEPCSVLDHVDVEYGVDTVTITLFDGSDPDAGMAACPDIAMLKQVTVPLDQDLAGRRIVDGA